MALLVLHLRQVAEGTIYIKPTVLKMINEEFSFKMGIFEKSEILKRTSEDHLPTIKWVNCPFNDGRVKGPADPPHPSNILYKEQNRNKKERDKEERKMDKIQLVAIRGRRKKKD